MCKVNMGIMADCAAATVMSQPTPNLNAGMYLHPQPIVGPPSVDIIDSTYTAEDNPGQSLGPVYMSREPNVGQVIANVCLGDDLPHDRCELGLDM